MKKFILYLIPVILLAIFIFIMNSGELLKQPFGESDDVVKYIKNIKDAVDNNEWKQAEDEVNKLSNAWEEVKDRIQFSIERFDLIGFNVSVAHIKGAIIAKDHTEAIIGLQEAVEYWNNLEE